MRGLNIPYMYNNLTKKIVSRFPTLSKSTNSKRYTSTQTQGIVIPRDVYDVLQTVAVSEGISKSSFSFHETNKLGEGYMGDVFYVTIQNKLSSEKREVVVKRASGNESIRKNFPVEKLYSNECIFYDIIWPQLMKFQATSDGCEPFTEIPKCYFTQMKHGEEKLVLENLKFANFEKLDRSRFLDKEHLELVFRKYGKFHGLSLAYKSRYPVNFKIISSMFYDYYSGLRNMNVVQSAILRVLDQCSGYLCAELGNGRIEAFQKYIENGLEGFMKSTVYHGENSVILHGDCWSNNLMFKYDESGKPIDLRLFDFQLMKTGTPVFDLSYFFYSSGTKETFTELKYYLKVYHDSLSNTLRQYHNDSNLVYPLRTLEEEWVTYSKFGFVMSLMLIKGKLMRENKVTDMSGFIKDSNNKRVYDSGKYYQDQLEERSLDLITHMYLNGFL